MLEKGVIAPDFCLQNSDEVEVCLRDLKGSWIVLYFYPKDNTPGCTTEACDFSRDLPDFSSIGATVVGISPDSPESHKKFIEKQSLTITLLSDMNRDALTKFEAWGLKKNFGKEYEGVIRSTYLIDPDGVIAHSWKNVRVKGHSEIVQKRLKSIQEKRG